jgi:dienelactone hydrolase
VLPNNPQIINIFINLKTFKMKLQLLFLATLLSIGAYANDRGNQSPTSSIKTEIVTYKADGTTMLGYVAYDSTIKGKRPVILVLPEWWGFNEYVKRRATQLAELGYIAMAVDMYGDGKVAATPTEAGALAGPFYKDPQMAKRHFDAALERIKQFPEADANNIAAIGYCFGGGIALNVARLGENLKGVVSFHGNLVGVPADKDLLKAKVLVCHGEADKFVTAADVATFKHQMDSIGAVYTFKSYPNATHAFTNPDATEIGKKFSMPIEYNEAADKASWKDMRAFFKELFK